MINASILLLPPLPPYFLPPQLLRGHVRRRRQRLRRPQDGARGHLTQRSRGLGRLAVHVAQRQHRVRANRHQVSGLGDIVYGAVVLYQSRCG